MSNPPNLFYPLGGGDEIGASSYYLQVNGKQILVDAGLRLKGRLVFPDYSSLSLIGLMGLYECDCVLITHAHLDHTGSLPAVYEKIHSKGHKIPIYATPPTKAIANVLLNDTIKIKEVHGEYGDLAIREFEKHLVEETIQSIHEMEFGLPFEAAPGIRVTFYPAGHILGAAMFLVEIGNFCSLFTGDFCGVGQRTVSDYRLPEKLPEIDLLVCESTYAYRKTNTLLCDQQEAFILQVEEAIRRGGKVLIPAFAVGRSQEVITMLRQARESGQLREDFPIYTDGMVNQVCVVYDTNRVFLHPDLRKKRGNLFFSQEGGIQHSPFNFRKSGTVEMFQKSPPCCVIASSGMLIDGSRSAAYASAMIEDAHNTILFTGYLDEESPGNKLLQANSHIKNFRLNHKEYEIKAKILPYHLSSHASLDQILAMVEHVKPRQVIFVHGYADYVNPENLFINFYRWGKLDIRPYIAYNQIPIYLG